MPEKRTTIDPQGAHGMEYILGINSAKINPDIVDMDHIKPVIDMNMQGYAHMYEPSNERFNQQNITLGDGTATSITDTILSYGTKSGGGFADAQFNVGYAFRFVALDYIVKIEDVAGALTGRTYRVYFTLRKGNDYVPFWRAYHQIQRGFTVNPMYYQSPGDWSQVDPIVGVGLYSTFAYGSNNRVAAPIVMPGWKVQVSIYCNCLPFPHASFFTFPVNSFIEVRMFGIQVPIGAPIPSFWG